MRKQLDIPVLLLVLCLLTIVCWGQLQFLVNAGKYSSYITSCSEYQHIPLQSHHTGFASISKKEGHLDLSLRLILLNEGPEEDDASDEIPSLNYHLVLLLENWDHLLPNVTSLSASSFQPATLLPLLHRWQAALQVFRL